MLIVMDDLFQASLHALQFGYYSEMNRKQWESRGNPEPHTYLHREEGRQRHIHLLLSMC